MKQLLSNIWTWQWFSEEKKYHFNGTAVQSRDQSCKVLIDPVKMDPKALEDLKKLGPFQAIYLTNKDHERAAYDLRREWKVPIWIHKKDAPLLKEKPDSTFQEGEALQCGIEVLHLLDQKSPGECAFYLRDQGVLIVGDALIGVPAGQLNLLPAQKYKDYGKAKAGLERLRSLYFNMILVGDGEPILKDGHEALENFFFRCPLHAD